jgi:gamma-glutamylcyclotransferase (GGCT)/AIG2-like uncharacterized protein YtfP
VPGTGKTIKGEVYSVDDDKLGHLDVLEEYPTLYTRRKEEVRLLGPHSGGGVAEAIVYLLIRHDAEMLKLEFISDYSSSGDHGKAYCR